MGNFICWLKSQICNLETSDCINLLGIFINSILAFWIVKTIQNRLTNKRVLKDHFISEVKDIRNDYKNCLSNLYSSKSLPKLVIPWFKLMNIRVNDLMLILNKKYKIGSSHLLPYQIDLPELITNNEEFIDQFRNESLIVFSEISKIQLLRFQQENNKLFNDLIIKINDAS
jgi:hypothetical protein